MWLTGAKWLSVFNPPLRPLKGELIMEEIEAINFLFLFQLLKLKAVTNVAAFLFAAIGTRMIQVRRI